MHIPDAVLSAPVAATTGVVALGAFGYGLRRLDRRLGERTSVLMGIMAAFLFAAQMVNFPLVVLPASGHLIGAVLASVMLGPWAGMVAIGAVLLVQALLFGDGGVLALGANFVNLGLIAGVGGYAIYEPIRRGIGGRRGVLIGAMAAAWFSVLLSSWAFAIELAASGWWADFGEVLGWMALVHAVIGLGEALITGLVLRSILAVRPDLVFGAIEEPAQRIGRGRLAAGGLGISMAVAAFLAPIASPLDDGLEYVGGRLGFLGGGGASRINGPLSDYAIRGLPEIGAVTAAAGLIGTLTVFVAGSLLARVFAKGGAGDLVGPGRSDVRHEPDAA